MYTTLFVNFCKYFKKNPKVFKKYAVIHDIQFNGGNSTKNQKLNFNTEKPLRQISKSTKKRVNKMSSLKAKIGLCYKLSCREDEQESSSFNF